MEASRIGVRYAALSRPYAAISVREVFDTTRNAVVALYAQLVRAMAMAMIYPEPEKGGRGKKKAAEAGAIEDVLADC